MKVLLSKTSGSTLLQSTTEYRCLHTSWTHTQMGCAQAAHFFLAFNADQYTQIFKFKPPCLQTSIHFSILGLSCLPAVMCTYES